ncbi:MAG: PEGA domain-containing protein [Nitrospiraceae bacterium]
MVTIRSLLVLTLLCAGVPSLAAAESTDRTEGRSSPDAPFGFIRGQFSGTATGPQPSGISPLSSGNSASYGAPPPYGYAVPGFFPPGYPVPGYAYGGMPYGAYGGYGAYGPPPGYGAPTFGSAPTTGPRAGVLQLVVDPVDANVYIDGHKLSQQSDLSYIANLVEGRHQLLVAKEGFKPYDQPLNIPGGGGFAMTVRLEK